MPLDALPVDFDCQKFAELIQILTRLKEITSLQASSADVSLAVKSINFLRRLGRSQPANLSTQVQQVVSEGVNTNAVTNAIINK